MSGESTVKLSSRTHVVSCRVLMTMMLLGTAPVLEAGILRVPHDYPTIQAAIVAASSGDQVVVGPGNYPEAISFLGKDIVVRSSAGHDETTIDATGLDTSVVSFTNNEPTTARLEGFAITGGTGRPRLVSPSSPDRYGGGIFLDSTVNYTGPKPTIVNCIVSGNSASTAGSGIYIGWTCSAMVRECAFTENAGATCIENFCNYTLPLTLIECVISSNFGAGVSVTGYATLKDCRICQNAGDGVQTLTYNDTPSSLERCIIDDNKGIGVSSEKNVYGYAQVDRLSECVVTRNQKGGIQISYFFTEALEGTLAEKTVIADNGSFGVSVFGYDPVLTYMPTLLYNCTVVKNAVSGYGYIGNSIVIGPVSGLLEVTYSDISGGYTGVGNIDADPLFVDAATGNYHLQAGSPCINTGHPWSALDADGSPADMGAIAYEPWKGLGGGVAGSAGLPLLVGNGPLIGGAPVIFALTNAVPNASVALVVGARALKADYKGGVFWPQVDVIVSGWPADATGSLVVEGLWPAGVPSGVSLWAQVWFADDGASFGFAGSNGVRGTAP